MQEIASLFAKVSANTSQYDRSMRGVRDDLEQTKSAMSKFGDVGVAAFKAVAVAGLAIGAGIVAGVGKSIAAAATMEQGIANISASMGLSKDEAVQLKDVIMDLGLDPKLKVTATEAADAIGVLGTAGLTLDEILGGAARSTVLLANSTGADFAQAGQIASDVMAQFNIKASDMAAAVDQITGVTVASKFDINDYGLAIAQAGGVASSVGVEFDDFNAVIAGTAFNFAGGSDAGTSFKSFLGLLIPTTDDAKNKMMELGLMTADGSSKFFDAAGNMKSMTEIADLLQDAFAGLTEEQANSTAKTLFGMDASRTAFALAKVGGETIEEMKAIIGNTSAEASAATRMDTLSGAWEIFRGVIDTVSLGIGDKFIPIVRKVVEWLTELAQKWGPKVIDFFGGLADKLSNFATGVGEMLGRLNTTFSGQLSILGSENSSWGEKMVAVWDMVSIVGIKIWQSLLDNITKLLPEWLDNLGEWAVGLWEWIKESTPKALAALWDWAKELWRWIVDNAPTWAANLWEWAKETWQWIVDVTPTAVQKLGDWGTALWGWLTSNLPAWIATLSEWAFAAWEWIEEVTPKAVSTLAIWGTNLWTWLTTNLPQWGSKLAEWGAAIWQWIVDVTPKALTTLGDWGTALWGWLTTNAPAWGEKLAEWGRLAWAWIVEATPKVVTQLGVWGAAIWGWLVTNGPSWVGPLGEWTVAAWKWIADAAGPVVTQLTTWGGAIWDWLTVNGPTWTSRLAEWGAAAGGFIDAVGKTVAAIGTLFKPLIDTAAKFVTWKDVLIGAAIGLAIIFAPTIIGAIGAALAPIAGFVAAWAPALAIIAVAILAVAGLRTAWENDWGGIQTKTSAAISYLQGRFGPLLTTIQTFGMEALGEIAAWATGTDTDFSAVNTIVDETKKVFGLLWSDFKTNFPATAAVVETAWTSVSDNTKIMYDYVSEKTVGLTTAIHDFGWDSLAEIALWVTGQETEFTATKTIWEEFLITVTSVKDDFMTHVAAPMGEWLKVEFPNTVDSAVIAMGILQSSWATATEAMGVDLDISGRDFTTFFDMLKLTMDTGAGLMMVKMATFVSNIALSFAAMSAAGNGDWDGMWKALDKIQGNAQIVQEQEMKFHLAALATAMTAGGEAVTTGFGEGVDRGNSFGVGKVRGFGNDISTEFSKTLKIDSPSRVFEGYGENVVAGFAQGFSSRWSTFTTSNRTTVTGWMTWFKGIFGIHSPSAVFEDYGTNIVAGLARGIDGARGLVFDAMDGLNAGMNVGMAATTDYAYAGGSSASAPAVSTSRIEELLLTLIQELRAKNMTANVTVAGGGGGLASQGAFESGLRGAR